LSSIAMAPWRIIFRLCIVIMVPFWMRMFIFVRFSFCCSGCLSVVLCLL
jgi:hypothetical protein